jgi:hypothetical protein
VALRSRPAGPLYAVVTLVLRPIGSPVDWSLAVDRLPAYLSTFVFVLFLGGGMEEPGWRGFGLPVLVSIPLGFVLGWRAFRLRNGVRSGKYAIERGDGPPSTVKDRTEDHGCACLCTLLVIKQCVP